MKAKRILYFTSVALTLLWGSCQQGNTETAIDDRVVVEGYLYQGETVDSIHLTKTVSFESGDTIFPPITEAILTIGTNNTSYTLQNLGNGYYGYSGTDWSIEAGKAYSLSIQYQGEEITSNTVVPEVPMNLSLSDSIVAVDTTFTQGFPSFNNPVTNTEANEKVMKLSWDNPNNDYFFVVIESIDPLAEAIVYATPDRPNLPDGFKPPTGNVFRFRSEPFKDQSYTINGRSLEKYGWHRVKLYKVNQEYADLYENRQQDSRNLTEPLTNINNGLGIFTAFSYAEATFRVIRKTE